MVESILYFVGGLLLVVFVIVLLGLVGLGTYLLGKRALTSDEKEPRKKGKEGEGYEITKKGAAIVLMIAPALVTLLVLVVIYFVLLDQYPAFVQDYKAHGGPIFWPLVIAFAIALAVVYTKKQLQGFLLLVLIGLAAAIMLPPAIDASGFKTISEYAGGGSNVGGGNKTVEPDWTTTVIDAGLHDLLGADSQITWHIQPGHCVDIYDTNQNYITCDCAGRFTDLRNMSPRYFAAVKQDRVEIQYITW